jgi:hypothetical protein
MIFQNQRIDKYNKERICLLLSPGDRMACAGGGNTLLTDGKKVGLGHGGDGSCFGLVDGVCSESELRQDEAKEEIATTAWRW